MSDLDWTLPPETFSSPDGRYQLTYFNGHEFRMSAYKYSFKITGADITEQNFSLEPNTTEHLWSPNSKYLLLPIGGYLIWDVAARYYTLIAVNTYRINCSFPDPDHIMLEMNPYALDDLNAQNNPDGTPAQRYKKPHPIKIRIKDLPFYAPIEDKGVFDFSKAQAIKCDIGPIPFD